MKSSYKILLLTVLLIVATMTSRAQSGNDEVPFALLDDITSLEDGDEIILVNSDGTKAMGKEPGSSEKKTFTQIDVNVENGLIEDISDKIQVITLKQNGDGWNLKVDGGYIIVGYDKNDKEKNKYYVRLSDDAVKFTIEKNDDNAIIGCKTTRDYAFIAYGSNSFTTSNADSKNSNIRIYRKMSDVVTIDYDENDKNIEKTLKDNHGKENVTVNLKRNFNADGGWYSLCLPFDVSDEKMKSIFGDGVSVQEFASASGDENTLMVNFVSTEEGIKAGIPYLIRPTQTVSNPVFKRVVIAKDQPEVVQQAGYQFIGIFSPTLLPANEKTYRFLSGSNGTQLDYPSTSEELKGTRAYFRFPSASSQSAASANVDDLAGISYASNSNELSVEKVYRLDGREVEGNNLGRGLYIIGNKKVIIK